MHLQVIASLLLYDWSIDKKQIFLQAAFGEGID